jgi:hypothetical protein
MAESSLNDDLKELHDSLIQRVVELSTAIGNAPDSDTVDALIREITEVNHRVTLAGNLLFTQQTHTNRKDYWRANWAGMS